MAPARLAPGVPVERALAGGETHSYAVELAAGSHLRVAVDQRGIDVEIDAFAPGGGSLGAVDTPMGRDGPESMLVSATAAGEYRIAVRSAAAAARPGRYEIRAEILPESTPPERERVEAERLATEAKILAYKGGAGPSRAALDRYAEALKRWRELGDREREAETLFAVAVLHVTLGEPRQALEPYGQAASRWQALGEPGRQATALSSLGVAHASLGEYGEALPLIQQALALFQARGDRGGEAGALGNLCYLHQSQRHLAEALPCLDRVLALDRELGDANLQGAALLNLGGIYDSLGEPAEALARYGQALDLLVSLGDRWGEAKTLNNLGVIDQATGRLGEAFERYDRALAIFRELGDRLEEARTLHNLGAVYAGLGELQRARAAIEQALALRQAAGNRPGEVVSLSFLGLIQHRLGDSAAALALYTRANELARAAGDRLGEANSLSLMGGERVAAGDFGKALADLGRAVEILSALGDRGSRAVALQRTGDAWAGQGDSAKALAAYGEALALRRAVEDRAGMAESLTAAARNEARLGRLPEARAHVQEALGLIESLRTTVANPELRASFLAAHRQAFELEVDLLMDLQRRGEALEVSERARARALLDFLQEARADVRQGSDPALRARERSLVERLNAKANRRTEALSHANPQAAADAERELQELLADLDGVRAEIRNRSPRYAALTQPVPLRVAEIQGLLDPGTLLLEYSLGEERSFLWAVDPGSVTSFELPPRAAIEAAARRVYEGMRALDSGASRETAAADLSRTLLGPVAGRLEGKRLVIVADGALHYLPFAALPVPGATRGEILLDRHEIVSLPSASVLATQRRDLGRRPRAPKAVAVLADPVFAASDPRVALPAKVPPSKRLAASLERGGDTEDLAGLQRLPATRREAERIAALLPPSQVLMALDFQANRDAVLGGELAPYRIVHFATHGLIDARAPELSGLALSRVAADGAPREGFLSLADLYNLQLGADLVVLSGCETALGREIRGEGLVGLTQGFFYAGAARVVASLWRVQDRATSELMARFYQAMLRDGKPPAAALREAQLAIRRERRWRQPYYWAAFVLQGDWR
ncbi:MAG TPA: CHAT domain-containing protein [Thermoanaerobaculia bacterium]